MRIYLAILLATLAGTSAVSEEKELYVTLTDHIPQVGKENGVFLGDRMLAQRIGQWRECVTPVNTLQRKAALGMALVLYKGGEPLCKKGASGKRDRYYAVYDIWTVGDESLNYEIQWKPKGNKSRLCVCITGLCYSCIKNIREDQVEDGIAFVYQSNSLQRTIEYTGRNGNILTFTYSEFLDGFAREAFNRSFQLDLDRGNVVAFKGAILEIIEATNIQIKYKVIRNFQEA